MPHQGFPQRKKEYLFEAAVLQATPSLKPLPPSPMATIFFHPHTYSPSLELPMSPTSSTIPPSSLPSFPTLTRGPLHSIRALLPTSSTSSRTQVLDAVFHPALVRGRGTMMHSWTDSNVQLHAGLNHALHCYFLQAGPCPALSIGTSSDYANTNPASAGDKTLGRQRKAIKANILVTAQSYRLVQGSSNFSFPSAVRTASLLPLPWAPCLGLPTHPSVL